MSFGAWDGVDKLEAVAQVADESPEAAGISRAGSGLGVEREDVVLSKTEGFGTSGLEASVAAPLRRLLTEARQYLVIERQVATAADQSRSR